MITVKKYKIITLAIFFEILKRTRKKRPFLLCEQGLNYMQKMKIYLNIQTYCDIIHFDGAVS